eukprot:symbB.v1.2.003409.t1/scaffold185.1/size279819/4
MKPRETARKGTAELGLPPAASSSKTSLRSKFNESAPPAWFRSTKEVDDDARSEADSVVSEFRDDGPDSAEASTAAAAIASSGSEAAIVSPVSKKSNLELELPAIPHRQRPDVSPMSASRSSLGATSNKSYEEEVQVSASTAGEWVTRLAALQEVAVEHSACAGRIWDCLKDMFPEVDVSTQQQLSMQAEIFQELEMSRQLLEQHAQGLVGTDLAELRMIQAETKRANDKLLRMDKLYAKETNALRTNLEKEVQVAPKEDYEPLLFLEPEERGCVLTLIQEQLEVRWCQRELFATRIGAQQTRGTGEMNDVIAKRREAYQSQRGAWSYGRKHGAMFFFVDMVLCPFFAVFTVLRLLGNCIWSSFCAMLSCLMQPHFFLGVLTALVLTAISSWLSCVEAPDPSFAGLRLVCNFDSPLASQAWDLLKSTSSSFTLSWLWLLGIVNELEHRIALFLLAGRCPFRDVEEAQMACQSRADLLQVRHARDCGSLRKAYHDGQRQVHPDLFHLQHPACSGEILQAQPDIALLTENPNLEFMMNQKEYTKLQELFKKERHSTLERQVAKLTQHLEEVTNQVTLLEAENEKLQKRLAQARRVSSSSSIKSKERGVASPMPRTISGASGSGEGVPRTPRVGVSSPMPRAISGASGEGIRISSPMGKPKAGRPKRGAKYSRPGPEADDSDV